jgi:hypothetical protein
MEALLGNFIIFLLLIIIISIYILFSGPELVKQKTEFVTSSFKSMVAEAIAFRNRFAVRPYLTSSIFETTGFPVSIFGSSVPVVYFFSLQTNHSADDPIAWPAMFEMTCVETLPDCSICLASIDKRASVTLSPCRKSISMRFLCRVRGAKTNEEGESS